MTTINTVRYAAITLLLLLAGCSHRVPQATIEVIDTSLGKLSVTLDHGDIRVKTASNVNALLERLSVLTEVAKRLQPGRCVT